MIPARWPLSSFGARPPISTIRLKKATMITVRIPSQPTSAGVPRDIVLSKP